MSSLTSIRLHVKVPPLRVLEVEQHILLPHIFFAKLHEHHREHFSVRILGGPGEGKVVAFWQAMEGHPQMLGHPLLDRPDFARRCIPLGIHGDGVPVTGIGKSWGQSVDCYSWSSLLSSGSTMFTNWIVFCVYKSMAVNSLGRDTYGAFWRRLTWSLRALWAGTWPDRDDEGNMFPAGSIDRLRAGQPLAGGYYAVVWTIRSDLEALASSFQLNHPTSGSPCCLCRADSTNATPWTDFRRGGPWESTLWTNAAWGAVHLDCHPIFRLPGVGILAVYPDLMHVKHLGTDSYFYGSVLFFLICVHMAGTREENLVVVWSRVRTQYANNNTPHRFGSMLLSMFVPKAGKFPKLKGKAAEIRHLARPLMEVARGLLDLSRIEQRQILLALQCCADMEDLIDAHTDAFARPADAADNFQENVINFLAWETALHRRFLGGGYMIWHVTIKLHYMLHAAQYGRWLNPRLGWTYSGEDLMQRIKRMIRGSMHGTPARHVVSKVMKKYVRALSYTVFGAVPWR